jgi:hypothetical protein
LKGKRQHNLPEMRTALRTPTVRSQKIFRNGGFLSFTKHSLFSSMCAQDRLLQYHPLYNNIPSTPLTCSMSTNARKGSSGKSTRRRVKIAKSRSSRTTTHSTANTISSSPSVSSFPVHSSLLDSHTLPSSSTTIYQLPTHLMVKGSMTAPLCWSLLPMIGAIVHSKNSHLSEYELLFHGDATQMNLAIGACVFSVLGGAAFNHLSSFCIQKIDYLNDTRTLVLRRLSYIRWLYPDLHVSVDCMLPSYGRFADYAKHEAQGSVQLEWLEPVSSSSIPQHTLASYFSRLTRPLLSRFTRILDGALYGSSARDIEFPPTLSLGMPPSAYESVPRDKYDTRLVNQYFVMIQDNTVNDVVNLEKLNHVIRYNRSNVE